MSSDMKRFLKGLGIFLALIGVGIASAFAVVALLLHQEEVRVPDLTGQDIVSVIETVAQQGLQLKVDRREPNPALPRDVVVSQTPMPGSGIKKGRQVHVIVSQGPSDLLAPKVVGENFRKADIMVRQAGFIPGDMSRVYSDSVDRDLIIAQYPQSGSPLDKGGMICMLVSSGKKTDLLVMPKLLGKKAEEALRIVDRLALQHRVITRAVSDRYSGTDRIVISQKPGAGYPVSADATVDIVISK
jgi:eukaryotic-like serine/threonine-protein kinase